MPLWEKPNSIIKHLAYGDTIQEDINIEALIQVAGKGDVFVVTGRNGCNPYIFNACKMNSQIAE